MRKKVLSLHIALPVSTRHIQDMIKELRTIKNKNTEAVLVSFNGICQSAQKVQTIHDQLLNIKQTHQYIQVKSFLEDNATGFNYYMASAGKVYANPYCFIGDVVLPYKKYTNIHGFLKMIGIQYTDITNSHLHKKLWNPISYKSTQQTAFTNQWLGLLSSNMLQNISQRRQIPIDTLKSIGNKLMAPKKALALNLIDQISTFEEIRTSHYKEFSLKVRRYDFWDHGYLKQPSLQQMYAKVMQIIQTPNTLLLSMQEPILSKIQEIKVLIEQNCKNDQFLVEIDNMMGQLMRKLAQIDYMHI